MSDRQVPIAHLPDAEFSVVELLASLRRKAALRSAILEAVAEKVVAQAARLAGLTVTTDELQQAADRYRQRHGLHTQEQALAWLARNGMRVADLEAMLEHSLLVEKFRRHLAADRVDERFAADPDRYARAQVSQFAVPSEGLARELLARVHDDGADFADLALRHATPGTAATGVVTRAELSPAAAEAVFQAGPDSVVGPVAGPFGWTLFHVHERPPAQLDGPTAARITQEVFDAWLQERLGGVRIDLSELEQL